jgi:DNA-binding NtrC family response regulator
MENNYYKLLNFVTKLSQPKMRDEALETRSNFTEDIGNSAIDIFENGIDNAEAIIAIQARKLLLALGSSESLEIVKMVVESQKLVLDDEQIVRKAFMATNGDVKKMSEITGFAQRTLYTKMIKYGLDRKRGYVLREA